MSLKERIAYDWKAVQSFGRIVPPMRVNSAVAVSNNNAAYCVGGKGVGQSNAMWKFHLDSGEWEELEPSGEAPKERDSHTLTYIGGDKLLLFGGQGLKTDNDRKLRQTKLQTYKVFQSKELFNDTHMFDCAKNAWHRILCKSQVPFSRRGHTATYIPPMHHAHRHVANTGIEDGSLVLYGGSGMDTFTGIEVAFNDLWVYSPDKELWALTSTKGTPPIPSYLHAATLQGDFLVIMGGITDPNPPTAIPTSKEKGNQGVKSLTQGVEYQKPPSGIMMLNIRTLCWSHLEVNSPDTNQLAGVYNYGLAAVSDPTNPDNIFVFGGRDTADGVADKKNSNRKQFAGKQRRTGVVARPCYSFSLDIRKCTLTRIITIARAPPNRYGHFCFSVLPSDYRAQFFDRHKDKKSGFMSDNVKASDKVVYIYGGCGIEDSGYCVPDMHQLVRSVTYMDVNDMNKSYFDEVSAMHVPYSSSESAAVDLDMKPIGSRATDATLSPTHGGTGPKHSSFVVDMNTTGDIFELSMWEKMQQMEIMVHNANELKKVHESTVQARVEAGLVSGSQTPTLSVDALDNSNRSSPRDMNRGPQTSQSPENVFSPGKQDKESFENSLMLQMAMSKTMIAPIEKKMPSNYNELKMSLSFSLSDISGSDRGVGMERYGLSSTTASHSHSHSRTSTAMGTMGGVSSPRRPGTASGGLNMNTTSLNPPCRPSTSGGRPSNNIFSDSTSFSQVPDGTMRSGLGTGMGLGLTLSQGSEEFHQLGSSMSIASLQKQRPQTAPGPGARKHRETRKPVVDTIPRPEIVAARLSAIRNEKKEVKKNARVIKQEALPNLLGKSLRNARDIYLTNNCPPALFPQYHPELTRKMKADAKKHHHHLTQAGTDNPVGPFFISSPKSQSMRATASNSAHHHGSKTDNFVRDL